MSEKRKKYDRESSVRERFGSSRRRRSPSRRLRVIGGSTRARWETG
jgi:hypothetical protein